MKHIFFLLLVIDMWTCSTCAQTRNGTEIPPAVKNAFANKYPHAKAKWDKEDANYEANFKQDGRVMSAVIDKNGTIVETETGIPVTDLPKSIQDYMEKNYGGVKIKEAARIVKTNGEIYYEAEVHHKDIVFDANGKFIKEVKD